MPIQTNRPAARGSESGHTPKSSFSRRFLATVAAATGQTTLTLALVLLIVFLAVWYATPYFVRNYINGKGDSLPDYRLHVDWVQINPLGCSIDVETVRVIKRSEKIPVPFLACPRVHVALQWSQVLHGSFRSRIDVMRPVVNFVQGPTAETSQTFLEPAWVTAVKQLVPLKINRFTVSKGEVHLYDFHAEPKMDLEMDQVDLSVDNLTNSTHSTALMPATAVLTGRPFKVGKLDAHLAVNVDMKQPTFAEKVRLENIPAPALDAFLAKYGSVYAKSGDLAFYTEMVSAKGQYNGYLKPFFQNLQFEPVPKDRGGLGAIWATLVNGAKDVLENKDNAVATNIPVSGHYSNPDIDIFSAIFGLVRNAYLQALAQGFNHPEIAPAPEKQQISPAAVQKAADANP